MNQEELQKKYPILEGISARYIPRTGQIAILEEDAKKLMKTRFVEVETDKREGIEIVTHLPEIIKRMESEIKDLKNQIDGLNLRITELVG
jgi:SMC interacting uncharacterized protein involved in chromosome segregation